MRAREMYIYYIAFHRYMCRVFNIYVCVLIFSFPNTSMLISFTHIQSSTSKTIFFNIHAISKFFLFYQNCKFYGPRCWGSYAGSWLYVIMVNMQTFYSINIQHIDCYCIVVVMLHFYNIADFYLCYDGAVDIQR